MPTSTDTYTGWKHVLNHIDRELVNAEHDVDATAKARVQAWKVAQAAVVRKLAKMETDDDAMGT